jgi:hypothetical protein
VRLPLEVGFDVPLLGVAVGRLGPGEDVGGGNSVGIGEEFVERRCGPELGPGLGGGELAGEEELDAGVG